MAKRSLVSGARLGGATGHGARRLEPRVRRERLVPQAEIKREEQTTDTYTQKYETLIQQSSWDVFGNPRHQFVLIVGSFWDQLGSLTFLQ